MADKMYVYRHGWDIDSIGNETVKVFSTEWKAKNFFEQEIRNYFQCSLEDLKEKYENHSSAMVEDDYVEIPQGNDVIYYIIEPVQVDAA